MASSPTGWRLLPAGLSGRPRSGRSSRCTNFLLYHQLAPPVPAPQQSRGIAAAPAVASESDMLQWVGWQQHVTMQQEACPGAWTAAGPVWPLVLSDSDSIRLPVRRTWRPSSVRALSPSWSVPVAVSCSRRCTECRSRKFHPGQEQPQRSRQPKVARCRPLFVPGCP